MKLHVTVYMTILTLTPTFYFSVQCFNSFEQTFCPQGVLHPPPPSPPLILTNMIALVLRLMNSKFCQNWPRDFRGDINIYKFSCYNTTYIYMTLKQT